VLSSISRQENVLWQLGNFQNSCYLVIKTTPSDHQLFPLITHPKNTWRLLGNYFISHQKNTSWLPNVFFDYPSKRPLAATKRFLDVFFDYLSKKHLATTRHFFQLPIQKMFNGHQMFSSILQLVI
jgi:hypothetical protein